MSKPNYPAQYGTPLTTRQLEFLIMVAEGYTNPEIAKKCYVAEDTVKTVFSSVLTKLGAKNRAHAVALAIRSGMIA